MNSSRDSLLDNLRGIAVLLMVFAHSIIFFNAASDPLLYFVSQFSDTIVFTTFLFVSGAVSYLAYMVVKDDVWPGKEEAAADAYL